MVLREQAENALARGPGALPRICFGDHAPADAGGGGNAVLSQIHRGASGRPDTRSVRRRKAFETLGRARLLQPGAEHEADR